MSPIAYLLLLITSVAYALWRGRRDERLAAGICVAASVLTIFLITPLAVRYHSVERGEMLVDVAALVAFVVLALRSARFWPLWVAGLQLTSTSAHLLRLIDAQLIPAAYGAAERFWSYPILAILIIGTWRGRRAISTVAQRRPAI